MKVVVTDFTFPDLEIEARILEPLGCELIAGQCKKAEEIMPLVADADAVLTQFAPVNAQVIAAMSRAKVIVRYGIGVDNVDLVAARERGIPVCNVPDYCIDEVADHTLAFILAATRQVVGNCIGVRRGEWRLATPLTQMRTMAELTVGIVGFGRIGREVANRLAPFKCRRLVYDPAVSTDEVGAAGCEPVEFETLLSQVDLLTLHCPSTSQTRRLINAQSLASMKAGAILVNLARGDLVDTEALIEGLQSGRLSGAALDVCDPEPIPPESPLLKMSNVIVASHVASASVRAVLKLRETAAELAAKGLRGDPLPNIVNGVSSSR